MFALEVAERVSAAPGQTPVGHLLNSARYKHALPSRTVGPDGAASQCEPLRVKRVILTVRRSLPVFHHQQTFSESVGMSQRCQFCHWHGTYELVFLAPDYEETNA